MTISKSSGWAVGCMVKRVNQSVKKAGYVKVRLFYTTPTPVSNRLEPLLSGAPPLESITVLLPASQAYSMLEAYQDAFELLKDQGALPAQARLTDFKLTPLDDRTLAYVVC